MNFNINHEVKVKLTNKGIDILKRKFDEMNNSIVAAGGIAYEEFKLKLDEDGYYRSQLWCLMQDFGSHIYMGGDLPFETNIILVEESHITAGM